MALGPFKSINLIYFKSIFIIYKDTPLYSIVLIVKPVFKIGLLKHEMAGYGPVTLTFMENRTGGECGMRIKL